MADTIKKTIEILFKGTDSGFYKTSQAVYDGIDGLVDPVANVTESLLKFSGAIAALTAGGLAVAAAQAGQFRDGMALVNTMAKTTGESFNQFSDDILNYSKDSVFALDQIQNAVYNAISLGVDYKDSLELVEKAEKLAIGGKAELNASLELLQGTMNAYGASVDETGRYSDTFFTIVEQGKTTIPELASSMSELTGIASAAQIPIEDVGASIAAITATGAPTAQSVTKLKALFEALINPSDKLKTALGGVSIQSDGLQAVMQQLLTVTGGSAQKMGDLFTSSEAMQAALTLANDSAGKFAGSLDAMSQKSGATQAAYDKMANNMSLANQKFLNNVNATFIQIGTKILGSVTEITESATQIFSALAESVKTGDLDEALNAVNAWGAEIADYMAEVAKAIPEAFDDLDFSELLSQLEGIKELFGGALDGLDLRKPDDLKVALQRVIDAFSALAGATKGVVAVIAPLFELAVDGAKKFASLDSETYKLIGQIGGAALAFKAFSAILGPVIGGVGGVVDALKAVGTASAITPALTAIKTALVAISTSSAGLVTAAGAVGVAFGTLIRQIPGVDSFTQSVIGAIDSLIGFTGQAENIKAAADGITQTTRALDENGDVKLEIAWVVDENGVERAEVIRGELAKPIQTTVNINTDQAKEKKDEVLLTFDELDKYLDTIDINIDDGQVDVTTEKAKNLKKEMELVGRRADGSPIYIEIDTKDAVKNINDLNEATAKLPNEKLLAIELQGEIDKEIERIKVAGDTLQTAFEWQAKLDIAKAETDMERFKASIEATSASIEGAGNRITTLYGAYDEGSQRLQILLSQQARQEQKIQQESHEMQTRLLETEIERNRLLNERIRTGQGGLRLTLDENIEPPMLELMKVFASEITTEAAAEGLDILYG